MNAAQMVANQRIADIANLIAAKQGQERAYDEIDVDLIFQALGLYQYERGQYRLAVGAASHAGAFPWAGSGDDQPCTGHRDGRE